jgi:N-methylhydantoinase A
LSADAAGRYRIAVDIGGTFTDVVAVDADGAMHVGKGMTQPERAFAPILEGLEAADPPLPVGARECLAASDLVTYGTTRAINAILEGKTSRTAFLTTAGFPDILLLREGGKRGRFAQFEYGDPYVPRYLTFEIEERIDSDGGVFRPLEEGSARAAIEAVAAAECEAVGVCLLWSIVNPDHELRVGELLEELLPGVPYTLSHRLNPTVREYRRASATVIDASLKLLMQEHLRGLDRDLREAGFAGQLLVATSFGGSWPIEEMVERPIYSIGSGPSMAPGAGVVYAAAELERPRAELDLLVCDTGGTTFDVSLVREGEIQHAAETWIGGRSTGHITGTQSVDVHSIGAGGGSIAWIDAGGMLRVGPRSAGARPGPACYGRGGEEPTVTDAALVLGHLDPSRFLGGRVELDAGRAREALGRIAEPLAMEVEEAAEATLVVATTQVVGAIRQITIAQGIDPRELHLVAGGGAAGINAVPIAREIGCRGVLLPKSAGAFSAVGALHADVISEFAAALYAETRDLDRGSVNAALGGLAAEAEDFLGRLDGLGTTGSSVSYLLDARYPGQVWDIPVALPSSRLEDEADVEALEAAFHAAHLRRFAVEDPGQHVECLTWRARASAALPRPSLATPAAAGERRDAALPARFPGVGRREVPVVDGAGLAAGATVEGPAIVAEPTTTVVLYPGSSARVGRHGSYLIDPGAP